MAAIRTKVDHTQCVHAQSMCIRSYHKKQPARPPSHLRVSRPSESRRWRSKVSSFLSFFLLQFLFIAHTLVRISHRSETNTNFVVWIFSSSILKSVCVCTWVGGKEEMGIERFQFHINIYRDIFENVLELINKVIVAPRCFQFRRNSFQFFLLSFFFWSHNFRLW